MNKKVLQLMSLLGDVGALAPETAKASLGMKDTAQAALQAEAQKKAKEKEEKKKKGKSLGSIGATLAGIAAAPFTGGMSLAGAAALTGAASAAGGAAGELIGSGELDGGSLLGYAGGGMLAGGLGAAMQPLKGQTPVAAGGLQNAPVIEPLPAAPQGTAGIAPPRRTSAMGTLKNEIFGKRANPIEGQGWGTGVRNIVLNNMDRAASLGYYNMSTPTSGRVRKNPITGQLEEDF